MSKCDVEIQLARHELTYRPGERVRGTVRVTANADVECRALTVSLLWRTHGRGNRREGTSAHAVLFQGKLGAGEQQSYTFDLVMPAGPATYHGTYLNVDHYVVARVDLPWALDPKAEIELLLPPTPGPAYTFGPEYKPPAAELRADESSTFGASCLMAGCFGLPGLGIMALGFAIALSVVKPDDGSRWGPVFFTLPFGGIFALVGFGGAFLMYKKRVAQRRLGTPTLSVSPNPAKPGDSIRVNILCQPRSTLTLTEGKVVLKGVERVVSGSGSNRTTHTHEVHRSERSLNLQGRTVEASQPLSLQATVEVPRDAALTFVADDNALKWTITTTIGIDGWPDWEHEYPLTVGPG
jgi:hypothetical protein